MLTAKLYLIYAWIVGLSFTSNVCLALPVANTSIIANTTLVATWSQPYTQQVYPDSNGIVHAPAESQYKSVPPNCCVPYKMIYTQLNVIFWFNAYTSTNDLRLLRMSLTINAGAAGPGWNNGLMKLFAYDHVTGRSYIVSQGSIPTNGDAIHRELYANFDMSKYSNLYKSNPSTAYITYWTHDIGDGGGGTLRFAYADLDTLRVPVSFYYYGGWFGPCGTAALACINTGTRTVDNYNFLRYQGTETCP